MYTMPMLYRAPASKNQDKLPTSSNAVEKIVSVLESVHLELNSDKIADKKKIRPSWSPSQLRTSVRIDE